MSLERLDSGEETFAMRDIGARLSDGNIAKGNVMNTITHGLSVDLERTGDQVFLAVKAVGKLTHGDYEAITPMIDSALEEVKGSKVKALFDATELEGWEPRAAWDDFKLGLKHGKQFEKAAIYGNKKWQSWAARVGTWFITGKMKYFDKRSDAIRWLAESD